MEVGKVARELDRVEIELIELCVCEERGRKKEKGRGEKREGGKRDGIAKMRHHSQ